MNRRDWAQVNDLYNTDFYAWAQQQAALLRQKAKAISSRDKSSDRMEFYDREPMRGCLLALEQLDERKDALLLELSEVLAQVAVRKRERDQINAEFEASLL